MSCTPACLTQRINPLLKAPLRGSSTPIRAFAKARSLRTSSPKIPPPSETSTPHSSQSRVVVTSFKERRISVFADDADFRKGVVGGQTLLTPRIGILTPICRWHGALIHRAAELRASDAPGVPQTGRFGVSSLVSPSNEMQSMRSKCSEKAKYCLTSAPRKSYAFSQWEMLFR